MIIDSSPFINLDRGGARLLALIEAAAAANEQLTTSDGVLAQVFRDPARQARLSQVFNSGSIDVLPIDNGRAVGIALAASGTTDVVDAAVAVLAKALDEKVLTADTDDFAKFDGVGVIPF